MRSERSGQSGRAYLRDLYRDMRGGLAGALAAGSVSSTAQGLFPYVIGAGVTDVLVLHHLDRVLAWACALMVLACTQAIFGMLRDRASTRNRLLATYSIVFATNAHAAALGHHLSADRSHGEIVSVGATDAGSIGNALETIARGLGAAVSVLVVVIVMFASSWQLGLMVFLSVPFISWLVRLLRRPLRTRQAAVRASQSALSAIAADIAQGINVLKSVGAEGGFLNRYTQQSQDLRARALSVAWASALVGVAQQILPGILTAGVVLVSAQMVATGSLELGMVVAFYGYAVFLSNQLRRILLLFQAAVRAEVAADHVVAFLTLTAERGPANSWTGDEQAILGLRDPWSGIEVSEGAFAVVVCDGYEDVTSIANRLAGNTPSETSLHGRPLGSLATDVLRSRLYLLARDAHLFAGRLDEELRGRAHPTDSELAAALEATESLEIVQQYSDGIKHSMGPNGRELSGGQRQRLLLARALLADPEVLIAVDPTSAVDVDTGTRIAKQLHVSRLGRTTIVFSTSEAMLREADIVFFIHRHQVTKGTHEELLRMPAYASRIATEEESS